MTNARCNRPAVTNVRQGYFAIPRLYGPTEAAIDKSWKPGEIELLKLK
jgi:hypothetical protein